MSINEKEDTQKLYYSISEVSEMFDLNASTLRFWEKEFEFLKPAKNKKGNRLFTQKDLTHIAQIIELVKQKGFTIQGAKEQLKNKTAPVAGDDVKAQVIDHLKNIRSKIIELGKKDIFRE
jgi:DNA-binding transcriptional MerR regulator